METTEKDQELQSSKPSKIETPAEFYKRITQNLGVRELLARLAKT